MPERRRRRAGLALGALALALGTWIVSFVQASKLDFDFRHFYLDGRFVWEHGRLDAPADEPGAVSPRQLSFYPPVVPLLMAPLTAAGVVPAAALWSTLHAVCLLLALRVVSGWGEPQGGPGGVPERSGGGAHPAAAAGLLALPAVYEAARFSQTSFIVLALALAGASAVERRRPWAAGVWFGLSIVLKLLPAVFLVWLALKRQWGALLASLACAGAAGLLPCLAVFGPARTIEYHARWLRENLLGPPAGGMTDPLLREHFIDHRNQSIPAVAARLCWSEHPYRAPWQPAELSRAQCVRLAWGVAAALGAALVIRMRRPLEALSGERRRAEVAACLLAMLVFSPLLRQYYLVWCLPALVVLAARARVGATPGVRAAGLAGLLVWVIGMLAWLSPTARVYGVHLGMLVVLGALLLADGGRRVALAWDAERSPRAGPRSAVEPGAGR